MEINLSDIVWPVCVLRCHEALKQLQPGEDLNLTVCDPDVVHNILLLIKSQPDLRFKQSQQLESYRIMVHRKGKKQYAGAGPTQRAAHERP
jgi:TusA-related sulfurtransferase